MRKHAIGLGIFALVFFLNLFFLGSIELTKTSPESLFSQSDTSQEQISPDFTDTGSPEGSLWHKTESSELLNLVRKYPAAQGVLFFLFSRNISENPAPLFAVDLSFSPVRDLSLTFHNLRI